MPIPWIIGGTVIAAGYALKKLLEDDRDDDDDEEEYHHVDTRAHERRAQILRERAASLVAEFELAASAEQVSQWLNDCAGQGGRWDRLPAGRRLKKALRGGAAWRSLERPLRKAGAECRRMDQVLEKLGE